MYLTVTSTELIKLKEKLILVRLSNASPILTAMGKTPGVCDESPKHSRSLTTEDKYSLLIKN